MRLPCKIDGVFRHKESPGSPELPARGLQIALGEVRREGERLRFDLLVASSLPVDYAASFSRLENSMVLVLRAGARANALALIDETVNPLEARANFIDKRSTPPSPIIEGAHLCVPIALDDPGAYNLYIHVSLHDLLSNVVTLPPPSSGAAP